jgi:allophanate hydrolase subunit 2
MTLFGGHYEAQDPLAIALAGAPMAAAILGRDGRERRLSIPVCCSLQSGDRLRIGGTPQGIRTYLAVKGGWKTPIVLGSRSEEKRLAAGVLLPAEEGTTPLRHPAQAAWRSPAEDPIRVIDGPDASWAIGLDRWLGSNFRVTRECDRMGLRIEGPALAMQVPSEPVSKPVGPGSIQVAGGQMLVLGVACGTMGGYPHVAHVISADLARIGQVRDGDRLLFRRVALEEARAIARRERSRNAVRNRLFAALATDPPDGPRPY